MHFDCQLLPDAGAAHKNYFCAAKIIYLFLPYCTSTYLNNNYQE